MIFNTQVGRVEKMTYCTFDVLFILFHLATGRMHMHWTHAQLSTGHMQKHWTHAQALDTCTMIQIAFMSRLALRD